MDHAVIEAVMKRARKGAKVFFGRNHYGQRRIKVKHGPLYLQTTRFDTDPETFDELKRRLREERTQRQSTISATAFNVPGPQTTS